LRLRSPGLARGRRLGPLAAGVSLGAAAFRTGRPAFLRLGRRITFFPFGLLRAQAFGCGAQSAADALGLLLLRRFLLLGLGVRVVLASDELDARDFRAVAAPVAEPEDPGVPARPRL